MEECNGSDRTMEGAMEVTVQWKSAMEVTVQWKSAMEVMRC